ncbi:MAG: hypothetical protein KGQ70_01975 [Alphaproteobacteria bacterium]|nr:hypothetical protein [Alphaproteobacteria bacterium]
MLYVLLAVGLLAALTYYFAQDSNENYAAQDAIHISEELYAQINMIKAAVVECSLEYPNGGPYVGGVSENSNNPFPINPSSANVTQEVAGCTATSNAPNCIAAFGNDDVSNLSCPGAGIGYEMLFSGANNQGRYLPPMPAGFTDWFYGNDATGVYITTTTTAPSDPASIDALDRLMGKFTSTQAVHATGSTSFKVWIKNDS